VVPVDNYSNSLQPVQSLSMIGNNPSYYMFFSGNTWNSDNTVGSGLECYGQTVLWANMTCPTQTYTYDHMKRLTAVSDTYYSRNFQYDVYGNMSVSNYSSAPSVSSLMPLSAQNPYNASNNQLIAATYGDARGNMTAIGAVNSIQYDGESRQIYTSDSGTGQSIGYLYDGMGQRMERQIAGGTTTFYVHDAFGNLAAEYNSSGVTPACGTCYLSYDELGSLRLVTDESAQIIARHDYLPFGEEILNGEAGRGTSFGFGNSATITQMFTGQERDGGTATLDYFNARHFSAVLGSMTQPDPGNAGGDILNPQSWNAYAYVLGNPLGLVDPSGMYAEANPQPPPDISDDTWAWWMNFGWSLGSTFSILHNPPTQGGGGGSNPAPTGHTISFAPAKNGKACAAMPPKPPSVDLSYIMNLNSKLNYTGWYNAVKNRGIWDFKQIRNLDDFGVPLKQSQYEDFGNWNFGLTAAQQGIPRQIALRGAGWAGQRAIGKSFLSALGTALGSAPYGDDSADQKQINAGYDYYVSHCY